MAVKSTDKSAKGFGNDKILDGKLLDFYKTSRTGGGTNFIPPPYAIERSLRFNSADSAYLNRTPASAGNRRTFTWSGWVKRAGLGGDQQLFYAAPSTSDTSHIRFDSDDTLHVFEYTGSFTWRLQTSQVFRDVSAWCHILIAVDTTQATASNRVKIYVNGSQVTSFSTASYPSQNTDTEFNNTVEHAIGRNTFFDNYLNGYLADIHFIDGQALDPSSFGEFDTNGVWQPIEYAGSYGTNGFHLPFSDNSTAAALGTDTSGNGNTWTVNNISVTAGAGNDSLVDSPTNYGTDTGAGGEVRGNYATLNPLANGSNNSLSDGNLQLVNSSASWSASTCTIGLSSGKWYWEVVMTAGQNGSIGIIKPTASLSNYIGSDASGWAYLAANGQKYTNGSGSAYGSIYTNNVIGVAFDADNGTLVFYRDNVSQGTAFTGLTSGPYFPAIAASGSGQSVTKVINFGQRPFAYTAPSGFKALCTTNLAEPTIADGSTAMDVALYTGNGTTQTISGLSFSPDFVWGKSRVGNNNHMLADVIRGATKRLISNLTNVEDTGSALTAFNSDGFSVDSASAINVNGEAVVAWAWDAGSSTVTNNDGSISSQVRANASAGFSVVTYTGNGSSSQSVGHGLGVTPGMFIIKTRSNAEDWIVWHQSVTGSPPPYAKLNSTEAFGSSSDQLPSVPTSTVINVGNSTGGATNTSGRTYVAYCFAPVAGYSSFGSYTGNGSADGPFVYTGFRPRFVLLKSTTIGTEPWMLQDSARDPYNPSDSALFPNGTNSESSSGVRNIDFTSNGFKLRTSDTGHNGSDATYIYAAFAEHPFQSSRAR